MARLFGSMAIFVGQDDLVGLAGPASLDNPAGHDPVGMAVAARNPLIDASALILPGVATLALAITGCRGDASGGAIVCHGVPNW